MRGEYVKLVESVLKEEDTLDFRGQEVEKEVAVNADDVNILEIFDSSKKIITGKELKQKAPKSFKYYWVRSKQRARDIVNLNKGESNAANWKNIDAENLSVPDDKAKEDEKITVFKIGFKKEYFQNIKNFSHLTIVSNKRTSSYLTFQNINIEDQGVDTGVYKVFENISVHKQDNLKSFEDPKSIPKWFGSFEKDDTFKVTIYDYGDYKPKPEDIQDKKQDDDPNAGIENSDA
jgi:ribosomal protein L22